MGGNIHSVPATFAGFIIQLDIALFWLAQCPIGSRVGIETLDDVVLEQNDGKTTVGQSKLSFSRNPLSDFHPNLWKTFSNWLSLIREGDIDPDNSEFHLLSNFEIKTGFVGFCKQPSATGEEKMRRILELARKAPKPCRDWAAEILAAPKDQLLSLLNHLRVLDELSVEPSEQLEILAAKLNLEIGVASPIIRGLRGWIQEQVEGCFARQIPALIDRETFCSELSRLHALHFNRAFILRAASQIPISDDDRSAHRGSLFVEQLRWVDIEDASEEMLDAVNDFLRSAEERTRLATENNVSNKAFDHFEDALFEKWKVIHRDCCDDTASCESARGRKSLRRVLDHREPLDGQETSEYYLTRGTYHDLANRVRPRVGWHPNFRELATTFRREVRVA